MNRFLPALMLSSSIALAASLPDYSGTWNIQAVADDGGVAEQSVTLTQSVKNGRVYLSGYGLTGPLRSGIGTVYTVSKDADATRTFSAILRFAGAHMNGTGQLREAYKTGETVVTKYKINGIRK